MSPQKALNNYLSKSIKLLNVSPEIIGNKLDDFTDEQLVEFWRSYKNDRDYSKTSTSNIPHWQTSKRAKFFELQMMTDEYYPAKNSEGKYVYDIPELKKHIKRVLSNDTMEKINERIWYKSLSFFEKLPPRITIAALCLLPAFMVASLIKNDILLGIIFVTFITLVVMYSIAVLITKRKRSSSN